MFAQLYLPDALMHAAVMKVTMLLADYAVVTPDNKLTIVGGGWSVISPGAPFAIAMYMQVPWDRTNVTHKLKLELVDSDGNAVTAGPSDDEQEPIGIGGQLQVGRPVGLKPGTPIDAQQAIQFSTGLPLAPGGRYEWRLSIDGATDEDWTLPFSVAGQEPGLMAA